MVCRRERGAPVELVRVAVVLGRGETRTADAAVRMVAEEPVTGHAVEIVADGRVAVGGVEID